MERWFPVHTQRLLLREFEPSDEAAVHEYACDPVVSRYDSWGPNTPQQTRNLLQRRLEEQPKWPRDDVMLAVELSQERRVIGSVRIWIVDAPNRCAEIGYTLNRHYWNQGYATEAAAALVACAFGALNAHRVRAICDTRNTGSWRVMEKLGMRREAVFVKHVLQKDEWRDSYVYAILHEEWETRSLKR